MLEGRSIRGLYVERGREGEGEVLASETSDEVDDANKLRGLNSGAVEENDERWKPSAEREPEVALATATNEVEKTLLRLLLAWVGDGDIPKYEQLDEKSSAISDGTGDWAEIEVEEKVGLRRSSRGGKVSTKSEPESVAWSKVAAPVPVS